MRVVRYSVLFLLSALLSQAFAAPAQDDEKTVKEWVADRLGDEALTGIRNEIAGINLLNSLCLTTEQMALILERCRRLEAELEKTMDAMRQLTPGSLPIYNEVLEHVKRGAQPFDPDLRKRYGEVRDSTFKIANMYERLVGASVTEVEHALQPFQFEILDSYKYCINPIITGNFIGSSRSTSLLLKIMDRVWQMPEKEFARQKEALFAQTVQEVKVQLTECEIVMDDVAEKEFRDFCGRIRQMKAVDFALARESLAHDFLEKITLGKRVWEREHKIYRLLLQPRMIPIYEERLGKAVAKE